MPFTERVRRLLQFGAAYTHTRLHREWEASGGQYMYMVAEQQQQQTEPKTQPKRSVGNNYCKSFPRIDFHFRREGGD